MKRISNDTDHYCHIIKILDIFFFRKLSFFYLSLWPSTNKNISLSILESKTLFFCTKRSFNSSEIWIADRSIPKCESLMGQMRFKLFELECIKQMRNATKIFTQIHHSPNHECMQRSLPLFPPLIVAFFFISLKAANGFSQYNYLSVIWN